jgi:SpoVK/Ycf46/Vps4 family AAA+-type ATPase
MARARLYSPKAGWKRLPMAAEAGGAVTEITRRSKRERGLRILVSGVDPSQVAKATAGALNLSLYRIPLSAVISKYIGETEKNLEAIFGRAERAGAVLLFDEADALFGKRTHIRDAHDRYANQEVSYLLKQLKDYDGPAILATKQPVTVNAAVRKRFQVMVGEPTQR